MKKYVLFLIIIMSTQTHANNIDVGIECKNELNDLLFIRKMRDNSSKNISGKPDFPSLYVISAMRQNTLLKCLELKKYDSPIDYTSIPDIQFKHITI